MASERFVSHYSQGWRVFVRRSGPPPKDHFCKIPPTTTKPRTPNELQMARWAVATMGKLWSASHTEPEKR